MSLDGNFVLSALLQHNFLPMQKEARDELPPVLTSTAFTPDIAKQLIAGKLRKSEVYQGYDAVDYKLTRFNGVSRNCSIPHPTAYAQLSLCICEHWEKLNYISGNKNSQIRPREHTDGRVIVMDYDSSLEKANRNAYNAFGRRFLVHTDISNFFPSLYSHAVPWATVGFEHAKKHKSHEHKAEWFNQLDQKLRMLKRNETQGMAIGPATSNIVSEAILARVDEALKVEFVFERFIDDYTGYCETEEEAQKFVRRLSEELAKYKLTLNINKTEIRRLPESLVSSWIAELAVALPKSQKITAYDAIGYLNIAVRLAGTSPEGSVMKYALKSLLSKKIPLIGMRDVLEYALTLAFYQPALIPLLERPIDGTLLPGEFGYGGKLRQLAMENARFRRSDGMAWSLYLLSRYKIQIDDVLANLVVESRDCVALLFLYLSGDPIIQASVVSFASKLDVSDLYELDQYWILLYQLFFDDKIGNPYADESAFQVLKAGGVSFIKQSEAKLDEMKKVNLEQLISELVA